jgi:hypothetical protein
MRHVARAHLVARAGGGGWRLAESLEAASNGRLQFCEGLLQRQGRLVPARLLRGAAASSSRMRRTELRTCSARLASAVW